MFLIIIASSSPALHQTILITASSSLFLLQVWPEVYLIFALDTAYGDTMAGAVYAVFELCHRGR
jgi:hypothetical protein